MEGLFIIHLRLVFCFVQVYSLFILLHKWNSDAIVHNFLQLEAYNLVSMSYSIARVISVIYFGPPHLILCNALPINDVITLEL